MKEKGLKKQKEHINERIFAPNAPKVHQMKNKKKAHFYRQKTKKVCTNYPLLCKKSRFLRKIFAELNKKSFLCMRFSLRNLITNI